VTRVPQIDVLSAALAASDLFDLASLLIDAVEGGALIHFLPPLVRDQALAFWGKCLDDVQHQRRVILIARDETGGPILGSVQLDLATPANQQHRAEVSKLLVHRRARRQGIAQALMLRLEDEARRHGRSLLTLDTRADDAGEALYRQLGYIAVGRVPRYARCGDGTLADAMFFYKEL
jgi:ribosomal protein S18 acetylase RimI-like enzyme